MAAMHEMIDIFKQRAEGVSAKILEVDSLKRAFEYTVDLCVNKEACQLLVSGCEEMLSEKAEDLCDLKVSGKIIAAPGLSDQLFDQFEQIAEKSGIDLIKSGLRKQVAGIDIGFTIATGGIAETGSIVLDSSSEDVRLATMLSEIHVAVVRKSSIRPNSFDFEKDMKEMMRSAPNYLAFITGASRTADIERVLALGVHGPLELHVILWEDKE